MKAMVLRELHTLPVLEDLDDLEPGPGEAIVRLEAASLNRRDYWITREKYPGIVLPAVLGSDGAGRVEQVGEGGDASWTGREVVINAGLHWGEGESAQSRRFEVLGMPSQGTLAEGVRVPICNLYPKPNYMNWVEAACVPVAGLTAYRALFVQGGLQPGETVLITGVGGGVASLALQMAVAAGARVWVTTSSEEKLAKAHALRATGGFNYRHPEWVREAREAMGALHLVLDSAGGPDYGALLNLVAPGGRIVNYGSTAGAPPHLDLFKVFWKQLRLIGSTMGSPRDFKAMLAFLEAHEIHPVVDATFPLAEAGAAIERLAESDQFGKLVVLPNAGSLGGQSAKGG